MANLFIEHKVKPSAHYVDVVAPAGLVNGNIVVLGAQSATDKTYTVGANAAATDLSMVIVCNPNLPYGAEVVENETVISTGEVVRARVVELGDVESYPVANVTATAALAVGKVVVPKVGVVKMECLAAAVGTEAIIYKIEELFTKAGVPLVKLRCVKVI
jgi:histidinol-phosphate/aromatic aminotransferase/cobyric acid decarboxylase-like protein